MNALALGCNNRRGTGIALDVDVFGVHNYSVSPRKGRN